MKDLYRDVNLRPLGPDCTPNPTMENPIRHNGWEIYKWTGWKSNTAIREGGEPKCTACGKPIVYGDQYIETQNTDDIFHFDCSDSPTKGQLFGQWVAIKKCGRIGEIVPVHINETTIQMQRVGSDWRYAYASAPGQSGAYRQFENFVIENQNPITPETPQNELETAREDALVRLKQYIDDVESGVAPWPPYWGPKEPVHANL